jgi:hypothetical protein
MNGIVQETPWIPVARKAANVAYVAVLAIAALPFAGGIGVGYFQASAVIVVSVGVGFWLLQMVVALTFAYRRRQQIKSSMLLYSLSTVFTFAAMYGLAVVLGSLVRRH